MQWETKVYRYGHGFRVYVPFPVSVRKHLSVKVWRAASTRANTVSFSILPWAVSIRSGH